MKFIILKSASDLKHFLIWVSVVNPNDPNRTSFQTVALYKMMGNQPNPWLDSVSFYPVVPSRYPTSLVAIEVYIQLCYQLYLDRIEKLQ